MKYQYVLNKEILFETNNPTEFFDWLNHNVPPIMRESILHDMLKRSNGHVINVSKG